MTTISPSRIADMTADQIVDKITGQIAYKRAPTGPNLAQASVVQSTATETRTTVKEVILVASSHSSAAITLNKFHHISISSRNLMSRVGPRTTICGDINTISSVYRSPEVRAQDLLNLTKGV